MIDLHTHILPHIDDGATSWDTAVAMVRRAVEDGVGTLVATPHSHHVRGRDIRGATQRLQELADAEGLDVTILPGSEVRIVAGLDAAWRAGELQSIDDGPWLLLELPLHDEWPLPLVLGAIERLRAVGARPILAHAERYPFVHKRPAAVAEIIALGVPVQVNAASLFYRESDLDRRAAEALIHAGLAHLIASDAHNVRYRPPGISAAMERVAKLASRDVAARMQELARAIVERREVDVS
ncbi:MAG: CpsB/CapC family capsule biosynthesis tyrosine phosphatase [Thermomicrobiales bacterium]